MKKDLIARTSIKTTDAKAAQVHLSNSTSFGGKLGYTVKDTEVIELLYYGKPKQIYLKRLIELGFTTFIYTIAITPFEKNEITKKIDLMTNLEVLKAFDYMSNF